LLGFLPAITALLVATQGRVLRAVQLCISGMFVCALAALLVGGAGSLSMDVVIFLGASLCMALTLMVGASGPVSKVSSPDEGRESREWGGTPADADIHRRTLEALRDRERELIEIVNFVPSNLWRLEPDGEPTFFNRPMVDFLGVDVGELGSENGSRLKSMIRVAVHPDDRERFAAELAHSLSTGEAFSSQYRLRRHDGVYRWMSSRGAALKDRSGRVVQWNGLCLDIDDQVRMEEALKRSEWHLQQLIDALPVQVCSWTPDGELLYVSKRYLDELGLSSVNLAEFAKTALQFVHPEDVEAVETALRGVERGQPFTIRYRRKMSTEGYRWTDGRFEPLRGDDGNITEWFGLAIDVDDEVLVQEALRENERSLKELVETLPTMIYCATPEGMPIYRSRKLQEFLGFGIEDKDGLRDSRLDGTLDTIIHPDDLEVVRQQYGHSLRTGEPYVMKHRLRRHDGEYRWVETRTAPMRSSEGELVQWNGVCVDIDDWVRDQEQLGLAQRNLARATQAASLAELTASIAHEVGQPLAAIVSSSDASQRWLSANPPNVDRAVKALERVVRSAETTMNVFNRVRALFKHDNDAKEPSSVGEVIKLARELTIEEAMRRNTILEMTIEPDLPSITLDRVQVQQVLVNLIRNGLEAGHRGVGRAKVSIGAKRDGDCIRVEVRDNGHGLTSVDRVFEPYFTTKADGMGMGLAICKSIVEAHAGKLWVENVEPSGALFIFTLPLDAAEPNKRQNRSA
jgi:PAS domain S-box-containing protein